MTALPPVLTPTLELDLTFNSQQVMVMTHTLRNIEVKGHLVRKLE